MHRPSASWWLDEPNTRGTYSLVSSCIFTLGLCVWTAIHLNIPERASAGRQFLRKLVWLAVGLLAPEVVTFTAWNQYADAARLVRELAKTARPRPSLWSGLRRRVMSLGVAGGKSQYDKVDVTEMVRSSPLHLKNLIDTSAEPQPLAFQACWRRLEPRSRVLCRHGWLCRRPEQLRRPIPS
jgi:hypothetical protein